jgi:hypothetical protein
MMLVIALGWALYTCADIDKLRAQGWTDDQLRAAAVEQHIPAWVIRRAERQCKAH